SRLSPAFQGWIDGGEALSPIFDQAGRIAFNPYRLNGDDLSQTLAQVQSATPFLADGYVGEWSAITYPVKFGDLIELVGVEFPR
ncbi:MAG TPA: hypothetical protein PLZ51_11350, partial [Aggregatilineales bacterium]|nr:hypothetical protein [Aggregatilineales bacterium]